jgi:hypothetical protein
MTARRFRIHPAIGIARVGNADVSGEPSLTEGFFIGPETPGVPANWNLRAKGSDPFRSGGRIKRQAVRFRIWEYVEREGRMVPSREVTLEAAEIERITWEVDVANTKASFYEFDETAGAGDRLKGRHPMRNPGVRPGERRGRLEIRPGVQRIGGRYASPVDLDNPNRRIPIETLGQLRTDDRGRLLVLGGAGVAASWPRLPPPPGHKHPVGIYDSYNNATWFDDVSDGPVKATITLRKPGGGTTDIEAEGAWVIVAPPDFAPGISSIVTLYDVLTDMVVRTPRLIRPDDGLFVEYERGRGLRKIADLASAWSRSRSPGDLAGLKPSYAEDIHPILARATSMPWVHDSGYSFHEWLSPASLRSLGEPGRDDVRQNIFEWLRRPNDKEVRPWHMPRIFADDYGVMPRRGSRHLTLTHTQYALMQHWAKGQFTAEYRPIEIPDKEDISPEGLDRAALENCSGGGFCPGMEVGWLITKSSIFSSAFRVDPGARFDEVRVAPGFFTQQLAVPWHSDFWECHKEADLEAAGVYQAWWPANRPDDVRQEPGGPALEWTRGMDSAEDMVNRWFHLGYVTRRGDAFLEEEDRAV